MVGYTSGVGIYLGLRRKEREDAWHLPGVFCFSGYFYSPPRGESINLSINDNFVN